MTILVSEVVIMVLLVIIVSSNKIISGVIFPNTKDRISAGMIKANLSME